jgi:CRP/FNR family transcriptional regulator
MDEAWKTAHADLLAALSADEQTALSARAKRRRLARGAAVFEAGEKSGEIFIVASGCIKLHQLSPGGKEIILWFAFPGELFGVAETMRGVPREIYATAKAASEVLAIQRADFVDFLRAHPEAALRAIGILSARVRTLGSALVELTSDAVETRLARLLLRFAAGALRPACGVGRQPGEICLNIDLTRTDIANLVGASRQTVTTLLARLQREGLVRTVDRHLHLPEPGRLMRMCDNGGPA